MKEKPKLYYIICKRHMSRKDGAILFWRPDNAGYTYNLDEAGLYTDEETAVYHSEDKRDDPRVESNKIMELSEMVVIENARIGRIVRNNKKNRDILNILLKHLLDRGTNWPEDQFVTFEKFTHRYSKIVELHETITRGEK